MTLGRWFSIVVTSVTHGEDSRLRGIPKVTFFWCSSLQPGGSIPSMGHVPTPGSFLVFHVYIFKCSHSILQLCASIWDHFPSELPEMFLVVEICWQQVLSAVFNCKHLYLSFDFEGFYTGYKLSVCRICLFSFSAFKC